MNKEYEILTNMIDSYDIISFDVFDTLLLRNVMRPSDIFKLLDNKVFAEFHIENFYNMRVTAEERSRLPENGLETNLDLIYNQLSVPGDQKEKIKNWEIDLELSFLTFNPFMKKIFDYCQNHEKKVICITDMYLPKIVIEKALQKNGYNNVKVYLSCDYMKQKRDGSLYEKVFNQTKYDKEKWLHIGDNYESDYVQAVNFGINAYHYKKVSERGSIEILYKSIGDSIVNSICMNQINNGLDYVGVSIDTTRSAIISLYKYVEWVAECTKKYKKIYFCDSQLSKVLRNLLDKMNKSRGLDISVMEYSAEKKLDDNSCIVTLSINDSFPSELRELNNIECFAFEKNGRGGFKAKIFNKNRSFKLESMDEKIINRIFKSIVDYIDYIDTLSEDNTSKDSVTKMSLENYVFVIMISVILLGGTVYSRLFVTDINKFENRVAYKIPDFTLSAFYEKTFQDNYELALSDQLPFADSMKLMINTVLINIQKSYYQYTGNKSYNKLNDTINLYDDILVYSPDNLDILKETLDKRVENINLVVKNNPDLNYYLYYIEKDTDINFESNSKVGAYEYISDKLSLDIKHSKFKIDNLTQFKNYFYETDHHWNYKGSYKGYKEIVEMMNLGEPVPIEDEICLKTTFSGSKATSIGGTAVYKEQFCAYTFAFPNHLTYINGNLVDSYGDYENIIKNEPKETLYGDYYGWDDGLIEFDYNANDKDNLLIIGESYDNAINELLSTHFNKTYNVDLRWYSTYNNNGQNFDFKSFVEEKQIDTVLFIGNGGFYLQDDFEIGVK